ncbi:uncharacterized protein LOC115952996 [Quercus lobata]|uniref:uncharacterized protein LOC115952996 n=1 Tax=Quercus lobata TaxID=97700 RepID=UPI00124729BC|nr:uncharacterized protein LOC115952996 [Quercus lobata]XP_030926258.1 uncharacterized protein LOC115952996 [Quercus lobata]
MPPKSKSIKRESKDASSHAPIPDVATLYEMLQTKQREQIKLTRGIPDSHQVIRTWDEMVDGFCSKYFQEDERMTFVSLCNNTKQNVNEGVLEFIRRFMDTALDCYDDNEEHELVEVCINNTLWEYRLQLEILNIVQFVDLLQKARRTTLTVSERR